MSDDKKTRFDAYKKRMSSVGGLTVGYAAFPHDSIYGVEWTFDETPSKSEDRFRNGNAWCEKNSGKWRVEPCVLIKTHGEKDIVRLARLVVSE